MEKRLSEKEKGFIEDIVAGKTGTEAALNNYDIEAKDPENVAGSIAARNLKKVRIRKEIESIAESIPDEKLLEVHLEGLQATTKKPHLIDRDDKGRPIYDYVEEDDYSVRHKYLDSAYKLKGTYAPEKHITLNTNVEINEKTLAIAKKFEEELNKQEDGTREDINKSLDIKSED